MCDKSEVESWGRAALTRRRMGALGAAGVVGACAPMASEGDATGSSAVLERPVTFATADGTMDGEFFHRRAGKAPGVIFWPDIAGIRPAKRQMARRLAEAGYAVLLANPYYRDVRGQQFADFAAFAGAGGFQKVGPWRGRFTADTILTDARAAAGWLRQQKEVDTGRGIGAQGYCMTGSFALIAPAATGELNAGASFHGGGLVTDTAKSPHRMLETGNRYLIAIAQNDDAKAPGDKDALRQAASAARVAAEIEVYPADHGWCVPDSPSYNAAEAERAWGRLLALYQAAL
ncbi:MAG TPA: dienelactone hydrolase family protein [Qipengyuania sp.]|nr:dienelactone hydrolase family protein [Qipengyuania sp.]